MRTVHKKCMFLINERNSELIIWAFHCGFIIFFIRYLVYYGSCIWSVGSQFKWNEIEVTAAKQKKLEILVRASQLLFHLWQLKLFGLLEGLLQFFRCYESLTINKQYQDTTKLNSKPDSLIWNLTYVQHK